jgi:hypothetical protein
MAKKAARLYSATTKNNANSVPAGLTPFPMPQSRIPQREFQNLYKYRTLQHLATAHPI